MAISNQVIILKTAIMEFQFNAIYLHNKQSLELT